MLNTVQLIGHLGRAPEVRYTAAGDPVANLSLATTERWTDRTTGERREHTEWHRISFFGRLAEVAGQYLNKGSLVYVSGQLHTRTWTDSDGVQRYATEIRGEALRMLSGRPADSGHAAPDAPARSHSRQPPASPVKSASSFDEMTDDIPF